MAKPPTFDPRRVAEVYSARGARERVKALLQLAPGGAVPFELTLELAAVAGSRCYRPTYQGGFPAGYVGFSGAVDLAALLPEPDRAVALLQGVCGAAAEGLEAAPNFAGFPWSHSLSHEATLDDLDQSIGERALPKFHGRLVPFLNEETRRKYGHRYLFTRSVLDFANDGQRHILVGRGLRLSEALKWRSSEECLYALSHYFLHAPQDYGEAEALQTWLEGLGKDLPGDNRNRKSALPAGEAQELEAAMISEGGKALFDRLLAVWSKGYSLEAIAEVFLLLAGARLARGEAMEAAARAVLFTDASLAAFPWLRGHDGMVQVLMCALYVRRLGAGPAAAGALPVTGAAGGGAAGEQLAVALLGADRERAVREAADLAGREPERAVSVLAAAAAARDTSAAEVGYLALAPILVGQFRRSSSELRDLHLRALAAWLARPGSRELQDAWRAAR